MSKTSSTSRNGYHLMTRMVAYLLPGDCPCNPYVPPYI